MRLAIAHDWLFHRRGGEVCWEEIRALYPGAELLALFAREKHWPAAWRGTRVATSWLNMLPGVARSYRALLPFYPLALRGLRSEAGLTISISHCAIKNIPVTGRHVCYCLTPARYFYDLRDEYLATLPAPVRPLANGILDRLAAWDREGSRGVTAFIAISQAVAQRIQRCYGRAAEVIYPPVDTEYFTPSGQSPDDFYLAASALVPYKRLDLVIAACRAAGRKLVVIGDGPCARQWLREVPPGMTWHRQVSGEQLRDYYRRCRALIFPAREDFGIIPVEVMACGRPVIALAEGGAAETVRDGSSGLFFREQSAAAITGAMAEFEKRDWPADACRAAALPFARERFQREFRAAVERVAAGGTGDGGNTP